MPRILREYPRIIIKLEFWHNIMKSNIKIWKLIVLVGTMFFLSDVAHAKNRAQDSIPGYKPDTGYFAKRFIHRLGVEYRPGYIFQTR